MPLGARRNVFALFGGALCVAMLVGPRTGEAEGAPPGTGQNPLDQILKHHLARLGPDLARAQETRWRNEAGGVRSLAAESLEITLPVTAEQGVALSAGLRRFSVIPTGRRPSAVEFYDPAVEQTELGRSWAPLVAAAYTFQPVLYRRASVPVEGRSGVAVYRDVYPDTDSVWLAQPDRAEELLWMRSAQSPREFRYTLDTDQARGLRRAGPTWEFLNEMGVPVFRMHPIVAWDATGRSLAVDVRLDAAERSSKRELVVSVVDGAPVYPILLDPGWSPSTSMVEPRYSFTLTRLGSGYVLAAGGLNFGLVPLKTAEMFDPVTQTWSACPSMAEVRTAHVAVLLDDGSVFVAGGSQGMAMTGTAERYVPGSPNPAGGTWMPLPPMTGERAFAAAVKLPDGKVWVTGGFKTWITDVPAVALMTQVYASVEVFTPTGGTGIWSAGPTMSTPRLSHAALVLPAVGAGPTRIFVAGGAREAFASINPAAGTASITFTPTASAEIVPVTGPSWTEVGPLSVARGLVKGVTLDNGQALIVGGATSAAITNIGAPEGAHFNYTTSAAVDRFDPASLAWVPTPSLATNRVDHDAVLLPTGEVLVSGGLRSASGGSFDFLADCELYNRQGNWWRSTYPLGTARGDFGSVILPNGRVLVAGGTTSPITPIASTEIFEAPPSAVNPVTPPPGGGGSSSGGGGCGSGVPMQATSGGLAGFVLALIGAVMARRR